MADEITLDLDELHAIAAYAAGHAADVLEIFERASPGDTRPREAIAISRAFSAGGKRGKALRDAAWAAMRAAQETTDTAASHAARAAMASCSAAYLHPLARPTQVKHILGSAAHAARAVELSDTSPYAAAKAVARAISDAPAELIAVLRRYPPAPSGGGRAGELIRILDERLRAADS